MATIPLPKDSDLPKLSDEVSISEEIEKQIQQPSQEEVNEYIFARLNAIEASLLRIRGAI